MSFIKDKTAPLGRGLVYAYQTLAFRPKLVYSSRAAKEAIEKEPVVFISNHVGHDDGQMLYMVLPNSSLMIAQDQMDKPIVKWVTSGAGFLPVDRFGMDIQWVRAALSEMKDKGRNMIIFPEGETEKEGHITLFKPGFAMLAVMAQAKVVPVYIDGEYHKVFGKRLTVYIGDPVELTPEGKGLNAEYLKAESMRFQEMYENWMFMHVPEKADADNIQTEEKQMQTSHDYFYGMVDAEEMKTLEYLPTFPKMLQTIGEKYADLPAISDKETTRTYAQLVERVAMRRDFLYAQGIKKGDHVGVMCRNDLDAMELLLAIPSAGAIVQMLPNALKAEQLYGISKKFNMTAMFVSEEFMPLAEKLECRVWPTSSIGDKAAEYGDVDPKDVACIFFTGGTTGAPKGAQLTQGGMMRGSFNGVFQPGKVLHGRYIAMLPLSHIFGAVAGFLSALYTGSCIYTCTDMRAAIGDIPVVKPTTLVIVPGLVDIIFNIAKMRGVGFLGGLHSIMCGAAPVPPRLMDQAREWGILMHAGYGLTEGANLTSGNCDTKLRPHSMGRIYPEQEYKVVDGELWIKGDNVMIGYYNDPEKTAEVLTEDGWLKTGDLVEFDEEGFVTITGRIKNLIILPNGENVSPEEIEDLMNGQPGVRDALCKEMELNGNTVVGVEVLPFGDGKTPEEIDAMVKKAVENVNNGLPQFKRIMKYTIRTEDFPRTGAMKIQR